MLAAARAAGEAAAKAAGKSDAEAKAAAAATSAAPAAASAAELTAKKKQWAGVAESSRGVLTSAEQQHKQLMTWRTVRGGWAALPMPAYRTERR